MGTPHCVASYSQLCWKRRLSSNFWKTLPQGLSAEDRGRENTAPLALRKESPSTHTEYNLIHSTAIIRNNKDLGDGHM